ncbi:MAG: BsuPI-related putative proteinase inhibitor, partial [Chthoniobacterales bacterium]|nr:BsuPI-related putative proteinase inhibitor [Chthoniobacterales bacterium]
MPFFATFKNFLQNISQEFVPEQKQAHNEEISLSVTPSPSFPISSYYEIHAKFTIRNNTNRLILLEFPSTQTFDLVLLDPNGSEIERWSTDQRFEEIPSFITINPKEKVVFSGSLSTRNLLPAKTYILYASIPGYP